MTDSDVQSWEYLERLQGTEFYRLYKNPSAALAIFRKRLSSLAKNLVMAMLYLNFPLKSSDLDVWIKPTSQREREHALDLLQRYHIITQAAPKSYNLTQNFAQSLRQALTGGQNTNSFGEALPSPPSPVITIRELDSFARLQWESILGYMVGSAAVALDSTGANATPSRGVIELLKAGHLIELGGTTRTGQIAKITKDGFAFVLQDINTQVWSLLFLYVDQAEALETTKVQILSFIFLVASLELGQAYSKAALTDSQRRMLAILADFGILYTPSPSSPAFYPTRLATSLTSESSSTSSPLSPSPSTTSDAGFIILETNYRLYAYTTSPLQTSLLALFTNLRTRHPNLITAKLTKHSIQRAVTLGITAAQIISYLTTHAHPQMRRHAQLAAAAISDPAKAAQAAAIIPATVTDQIHLWQLEGDRMATTPGFLMREFKNAAEYDRYVGFAEQIGVLVWRSDAKRMFFVSSVDGLRRYMASLKGEVGAS